MSRGGCRGGGCSGSGHGAGRCRGARRAHRRGSALCSDRGSRVAGDARVDALGHRAALPPAHVEDDPLTLLLPPEHGPRRGEELGGALGSHIKAATGADVGSERREAGRALRCVGQIAGSRRPVACSGRGPGSAHPITVSERRPDRERHRPPVDKTATAHSSGGIDFAPVEAGPKHRAVDTRDEPLAHTMHLHHTVRMNHPIRPSGPVSRDAAHVR